VVEDSSYLGNEALADTRPLLDDEGERSDESFFRVLILHKGDTTTVILRGELELHSAGAANEVVTLLSGNLSKVTILDFTDLTFLDAIGVSPLVRLANAAAAAGCQVTARNPSRSHGFVLSLTPIAAQRHDHPPIARLGRSQ
jgi:anti-anti-sigma factor